MNNRRKLCVTTLENQFQLPGRYYVTVYVCILEGSENRFFGTPSRKTYNNNTQNRAISELTSMELPKKNSKSH